MSQWTDEKKLQWLRARVQFSPVCVHSIVVGMTNIAFGKTKFGNIPTYSIHLYFLHVNKRGQIVSKRLPHVSNVMHYVDDNTFYSPSAAVKAAKAKTTTQFGHSHNPVKPTVWLQTRGIVPDHVIPILFDRLQRRALCDTASV